MSVVKRRALRARKHYLQEKSAEIMQEYLNRLENEKYIPSRAILVKLALALKADLNILFRIKNIPLEK